MNKYQARCRLTAGHKITHAHFLPDQYVELIGGAILNEEGYRMQGAPYNPFGGEESPLEGWGIYELETEEE